MKIKQLVKKIEKDFPKNSSMDFDNTGLNIGDEDNEFNKILVCLDPSLEAINYAIKEKCDFIVSHHPLTFLSYKNILSDINSRRIKLLIENKINAYSMHTNFDVNIEKGMGNLFVNTLGINNNIKKISYLEEYIIDKKKYAFGNIVELNKKMKLTEIYNLLIKNFNLNTDFVSFYKSKKEYVNSFVICPGSGKGQEENVINQKVDLFITSDLPHNSILDLLENDISYINATHYGSEKIFVEYVYKYLLKVKGVNAIKFYSNIM